MISSLKSSFELSDKRALLIGSDKSILYEYDGGRLSHSYVFSADEAELGNFGRYLGQTPKSPVYVLIDIVEEEYRHDVVPHVFGSDRKAVVERKFTRLFRGTNYHYAQFQGRETDGRRDDRVLLTALTKPEVVSGWIDQLREHKVPIAGIYSLPIVSQIFLQKIAATGPNVLLISVQSAGGLRQTFFRDRQFMISRLAPMPRLGSVPYAAHLTGELEKLRRYLNSLGMVSPHGPLQIYILSHGALLSELEKACADSDEEKYFLIDTTDVSKRLGFAKPLTIPYSDAIFAHLLLGATPKNHYASDQETQYFRLHRTRRGLLLASLLLLLGSVGWSGFNFIEGVSLKQQGLDAAEKAEFYHSRYTIAREDLPPTPVEPMEIKTAVDAVAALQQRKSSPVPMLAVIGRGLDRSPGVEMDRFEWFASVDPNAESTTQKKTGIPSPDEDLIPRNADYSHYQIARLEGHVTSFGGDYRQAIEYVDALAAALGELPDMQRAEVVKYPLDVGSNASVAGTATDASHKQEAHFTLKLVLGIKDGSKQS